MSNGTGLLGPGVLPAQAISAMIAEGSLAAQPAIRPDQIQPASLDLRLGATAYRVRASFLAGKGRKVADRLAEFEMHRFSLEGGAMLDPTGGEELIRRMIRGTSAISVASIGVRLATPSTRFASSRTLPGHW